MRGAGAGDRDKKRGIATEKELQRGQIWSDYNLMQKVKTELT